MTFRVEWMARRIEDSRSGPATDYSDPNNGVSPEVLDLATQLSAGPFTSARLAPEIVLDEEGRERPGYLFARVGADTAFLAYVRVTFEGEQEDGAGRMPARLFEFARAMNAEPRVLRVHFRPGDNGTYVTYFGHDDLERELKSCAFWRRALIGKRTARDYLRLCGKLSRLEVQVCEHKPGPWPISESIRGDTPAGRLLQEIFGEDNERRNDYPGSVSLRLRVDTLSPQLSRQTISIRALLASAVESDEHFIFTCSCGQPECADIWSGVETVHEAGLVVWRIRGLRPRRVVVFDRAAYQDEILSKAREALARHSAMGPDARLGAGERRQRVEEALFLAESVRAGCVST